MLKKTVHLRLRKSARTPQKRAQKSAQPIAGAHYLLAQSLRFWAHHRRPFGLAVLVALGVDLLLQLVAGASLASYQGIWFVFASCALIWAIRQLSAKKSLKLSETYWVGSAAALKFIIVLAAISIASIPFSIGAFLFSIINLSAGGGLVAEAITGALWLSLTGLSLMLLARLVCALIIVTLPQVGPWSALRLSWRTSRGRTVVLTTRLMIMVAYLGVIAVVAGLGVGLLSSHHTLAQIGSEMISIGLILPIVYIFLYQLYEELI